MDDKVAVVTGANKGIGYATVRKLCERGLRYVYYTEKIASQGQMAIDNLKKEGVEPLFHQLDATDKNSVKTFAEYLKQKHGGVDILINNSAIPTLTRTFKDSIQVIDANYYNLLTIQEYIFPILKDNARVINISNGCGHISNLKNKYWMSRLAKEDIKREDVNAFMSCFFDSVKNGSVDKEDFQEMHLLSYRNVKIALCALTRAQQNEVKRGISVNSLHPGFIKTDNMTETAGFLTKTEASEAPVYLALDIDQSVKGKYFWFDRTERKWPDPNQKLHCTYAVFDKCLRELNQV